MPEPEAPPPSDQPAGHAGSPTPEEMRRAMKAFKKRLKLTRLDDESSLGHGPMSGGRSSGVVAIMPPNQYPRAVWDALVEKGRLKYAGQGLFQMADS